MPASARKQSFHFSPTDYHRDWMDRAKPAMRFSGGDFAAWRRRLRAKVAELTGVAELAARKRVPLNVRSLWKRAHPLGSIEKIVFTSEPFADVPAYVCLPKHAKPPYTFLICMQGHTTGAHISIAVDRENDRKPFKVEGDRDFGLGCLRHGVAALCIEQRSFGYRRELKQKQVSTHGCHDATMHALMLGGTLLGERTFDVDRAIDYLASRGDAAMQRIGVMGNSGGGTISLFSAALFPRIAVAMPSCYFCTFRDSLMSIHHCADNYVPGLLRYAEMSDVMGLFAPKPVVLVAGRTDTIFPIAAVRRSFRDLKRIYNAAGEPERCHLVVGKEGHRFYEKDAWPVLMKELRRLGHQG